MGHVGLRAGPRGVAATELCWQLVQVARVIAAQAAIGAERDVFFVSVGGFDTHSDEGAVLASKFSEINLALEAFMAEMRERGVWEQVASYYLLLSTYYVQPTTCYLLLTTYYLKPTSAY